MDRNIIKDIVLANFKRKIVHPNHSDMFNVSFAIGPVSVDCLGGSNNHAFYFEPGKSYEVLIECSHCEMDSDGIYGRQTIEEIIDLIIKYLNRV